MVTYIIRRLLQMIPVLIGSTFLIFVMVFALPGDPVSGRCGERACPEAYVQKFTQEYHLDKPVVVQYAYYVGKLAQGDLGTNFYGNSVRKELAARYPTTAKLAVIAIVFEVLVGIVAGVVAGMRKGRWPDTLVTLTSLLIISIPVFVLGSLAQLVFGIKLAWFPVTSTAGTWSQLLLPGLVLGSVSVAYVARLTRTNLVENLRSDYVRTAKAKGLGKGRAIGIHTLRNSLIPVVTYIGYDFGALLGGAIVTERIFNINGIGSFIFRSITARDGVSVVGAVVSLVFVYLIMNLLVDLLYGVLDPRISHD
ncbi:oligopeptide transport system permease protein [Raineyella antarctica]|uniref:Oligopeptide transport system permease protein n=1 Tax=Raineyella antarctica TaxID=1577474 RepID=A0A1G6GDH2_9ACTN|nr:ABC transporter permease [Raineyella antarctica]SDB80041.1 oligopeptide transport system permease protein [Raineyella antarctica]